MKMRPFGRLLPLEIARARLIAAAVPIDRSGPIDVADALGRIVARPIRSPADVPRFARATWDGYALRAHETLRASADAPAIFRIVGEVHAEEQYSPRVRSGEAVAIATGGMMPRGADTVVLFEDAKVRGKQLHVPFSVPPQSRIAPPGEEFRKGSRVAAPGDVLTPAALGTLSACGLRRVHVYSRPIVTIVPNGNELALPGERLRAGQIFEGNNATIGAIVRASGGVVRSTPPVADDPRRIEATLRDALRKSDLVIATGGSSVGEHDFLPTIFPRIGRLLFHGIAVRPGKPTLAVRWRDKLLVGMPGHPTSCFANALWLLMPTLRKLARWRGPGWIDLPYRLAGRSIEPNPTLATVVLFHIEGINATPPPPHTHAIAHFRSVDAFAIFPPGSRTIPVGRTIRLHRLYPPTSSPISV
jgi:molybdopterin molybdotransferase